MKVSLPGLGFGGTGSITPCCLQQNGMIEWAAAEQCAHHHPFESKQHANLMIGDERYNHRRPQQALGSKMPAEAGVPAACPAQNRWIIPWFYRYVDAPCRTMPRMMQVTPSLSNFRRRASATGLKCSSRRSVLFSAASRSPE